MKYKTINTKALQQSSLEKWYSEIEQKNEKDYSVEDICCMLRQDYKTELAASIGIELLRQDPFIGSLCDGELLSAFIRHQKSYIYYYRKDFDDIYVTATTSCKDAQVLLERFDNNEDLINEARQLTDRLYDIISGKESNLHLELISQVIKRHYEVVRIGTNVANPEFTWHRFPCLPIVFGKSSDVKQLKRLLRGFKGNCNWILHRRHYSKNKELYFLTIREKRFPCIYSCIHKNEPWKAAISDILPLSEYLESSLSSNH